MTGAGGFIGSHLVRELVNRGFWVRGVDIKRPDYSETAAHDFVLTDLRVPGALQSSLRDIECVYALAADIGGMGHISQHEFSLLTNNTHIDINTFEACARSGVRRVMYASSACVYPRELQAAAGARRLAESDAWPADPDGAYGFEKLAGEVALKHLSQQFGTATVAVRLHNVYGPEGTFDGGREKVPAALCRKIAVAKPGVPVEIWGDGRQIRSFCFVSDCVAALAEMATSGFTGPINIGTAEALTITELAEIIKIIAGARWVEFKYVEGPQGVRSRNCDNSLALDAIGWSPVVGIESGLRLTYDWIRQSLGQRAGDGTFSPQ